MFIEGIYLYSKVSHECVKYLHFLQILLNSTQLFNKMILCNVCILYETDLKNKSIGVHKCVQCHSPNDCLLLCRMGWGLNVTNFLTLSYWKMAMMLIMMIMLMIMWIKRWQEKKYFLPRSSPPALCGLGPRHAVQWWWGEDTCDFFLPSFLKHLI